jgi:excisionase family DNA binding protein
VPKSSTAVTEPLADKFGAIGIPYPRPITKDELAAFLRVSDRTVDNYVIRRVIPYLKIGRAVRFRLADVEKALSRYTIKEVSLS